MTLALWGAGLLAAFFAAHFFGILVRARAAAAFLGIVFLCQAGFLASALGRAVTVTVARFGGVTASALGFGAAALLLVLVVVLGFAVGVHMRSGGKRHTGWLALALGLCLVLAAPVIPALSPSAWGL